ncbi:Retrovirus-related Pol polyprotein from transposon RE2 [Vitis vinifera]|uniref:Retrovirus-related Pol polyprotein from transposon RE2 n=1 Tax=Vitis vinifera TaxID=29760 RepID=A0A438H2V4_VITVI|nr:Retrovirus-related Pol polyprotein from transposon RE2 [Vitis vinifera]
MMTTLSGHQSASVAQTGNASACFTHTSSFGPWILDFGASDHISGNKDFFSSITTTSALPTVTLANGSQTMVKGFGFAHPLPSLPLHSVLYAPECPFNLISISKITCTLNCSITFSDKFVTLQDRSTGKMIGIGRESQGLYHLTSPSPAVAFLLILPSSSTVAWATLVYPSFRNVTNAREYFFAPFTSFMSQHGIIHQSSCAHTPQQNGVAKRQTFCQSLKMHLLGIFQTSKGYRCYSSETHCYFLSADCLLTHFKFIIVVIVSLFLLLWPKVPADSPLIPSASLAPALPPSTDLPIALRKVGCRWVYTVKVGPDGQVDRLKACLVAKGYTQVYGSDYGDTFSPVAKIAFVRLLLSMTAMRSWPLYQLDIKNAFLHGDLAEEVYMEQPPGFVAQGEFGLVCRLRCSLYGLKTISSSMVLAVLVLLFRSLACSAVQQTIPFSIIITLRGSVFILVVYMDNIVITGSDQNDSSIQFRCGSFLRKYALDILEETGMLDYKPVDTPMDPNVKLIPGQGEPLGDPGRYRRLVGKLNYLTITRPDISFPGSVIGLAHPDRRFTSGYCVFIGGNLISWKSKKQDVVARSSAEAEYRAMALATCELIWMKHLLRELRFGKDEQMKLICDNQAALHIAFNPVFHERTKYIEVDCHFIREKIASGCMTTSFVNSND